MARLAVAEVVRHRRLRPDDQVRRSPERRAGEFAKAPVDQVHRVRRPLVFLRDVGLDQRDAQRRAGGPRGPRLPQPGGHDHRHREEAHHEFRVGPPPAAGPRRKRRGLPAGKIPDDREGDARIDPGHERGDGVHPAPLRRLDEHQVAVLAGAERVPGEPGEERGTEILRAGPGADGREHEPEIERPPAGAEAPEPPRHEPGEGDAVQRAVQRKSDPAGDADMAQPRDGRHPERAPGEEAELRGAARRDRPRGEDQRHERDPGRVAPFQRGKRRGQQETRGDGGDGRRQVKGADRHSDRGHERAC